MWLVLDISNINGTEPAWENPAVKSDERFEKELFQTATDW